MASSKNKITVHGSDDGEADLSQDVEWLSSLSESELDFLIGLKELVIRRAKNAGCKDLAEQFDARMLRGLGIVLMEHFKAHAESASITTNVLEASALLRDCHLLTPNCEKNDSVTISEDVRTSSFVTPRRKRMWEGLCEERASSSKKRKTARKLM